MFIESIELKNYRNYDELHMDFNQGINILYGDNAQGKTNVLESIYLCSTSKSHRGSKDREIIKFDCEESHIKININKNDVPYRIDMHLKKNKAKGIAINGIPIKRASELFGLVNVVFFSPEDLNLIKNGPSERRKFIDLELCQINKLYLHSLVKYNKVIVQRNKLLKEISYKPEYEETIDVWDQQLLKYGIELIRYRNEFIKQLNDIILTIHKHLSGEKEELKICYEPNVCADSFASALKKSRAQDLRQRSTLVGPHRDDIAFFINNVDARKYGSQGQQRTAALSLKLAEIELVQRMIKDYPILLLDDVLSELDRNRQNYLLSGLHKVQTIITCTGLDDFLDHRLEVDRVFQVISGIVTCVNDKIPSL